LRTGSGRHHNENNATRAEPAGRGTDLIQNPAKVRVSIPDAIGFPRTLTQKAKRTLSSLIHEAGEAMRRGNLVFILESIRKAILGQVQRFRRAAR